MHTTERIEIVIISLLKVFQVLSGNSVEGSATLLGHDTRVLLESALFILLDQLLFLKLVKTPADDLRA